MECGFYFEGVGAGVVGAFRRDVFDFGGGVHVRCRSDDNFHRHPDCELPYFRFVDFAFEYQVVHVSDRCNSRAVVECVGLDYGAADFHRHIENQTGDCGAYESVAFGGVVARYAVAHDVESIGGGIKFLLCLFKSLERILIFLAGDDFAFVEGFVAFVFDACILKVYFGDVDAVLSRRQRRSFRYDFDFCDYITYGYAIAGFYCNIGYDA